MVILEEATYEIYGYYSSELTRRSGKPILAACDECSKTRVTSKHIYRDLCLFCSQKGRTYSKAMTESFFGFDNPAYKGGKVKRICKQCSKAFWGYPYRIKNGKCNYCSISCSVKAQRHNAKSNMTLPEHAFESVCIKHLLPFRFVGDGSVWLGSANPDFVHTTKKIVVEVFGDYWHSPLLNRNLKYIHTIKGRSEQLKREGYKAIFIWESDLMRLDAEAFVMHLLKKRKAL